MKTTLIFLLFVYSQSFLHPISFTIVRNIYPPLNADSFLTKTGCCPLDSNNNNIGYNLISLDGFSSTTTLANLQNKPNPLSFWANAYQSIVGNKLTNAGNNTAAIQKYLLDAYHRNKSRLLFNAFANQASISKMNASPDAKAQDIANIVLATQLDGVSIEFQDYHSVVGGTASQWLNTLLQTLRNILPQKIIVLVIPPTFLTKISILQQQIINSYVSYFVLRYTDINGRDYYSSSTLITKSQLYPGTAFVQLIHNKQVSIDFCRTIIAKSADSFTDRTSSSFIDANSLAASFNQLNNDIGWFGGYGNLDFQADQLGTFQLTSLSSIRDICIRQGNCFCK